MGAPVPSSSQTLVCYTAVFRVVTSLSLWGGALRDDTKNGCVADYPDIRYVMPML